MIMSKQDREFQGIINCALDNKTLQTALLRATSGFKALRDNALKELGDFESLRLMARAAKDKTLNNLEYYLANLENSVKACGGHVHWASDGREVIDYILDLAHSKSCSSIVKGKSMTSEEIDLNPALENAGLDVFETDLGEYIIQMLGERPSHIIAPAIHRTKEEVGRLCEEKLGLPYTDVPEEMTRAVRRELRTKFLGADMGVTGVNFAVAETGSIVLLENEGNIRMSTTLPRIHVAVMGLEKVIADMKDLSVLLRILPLSAVGQRLPGYVSIINGAGRNKGEGPEEFHLVIFDGFRSRVLADPLFRQILRCLRCGACINSCPVYRRLGGHSYPWVYSGPVGTVLTGAAKGPEAAHNIAKASTLCRACGDACPVMIDLPGLILELRRRSSEEKAFLNQSMNFIGQTVAAPLGYDMIGRTMERAARSMIDPKGGVRHGPERLKNLGQGRRLPRPAEEPFHRSLFRGDENE